MGVVPMSFVILRLWSSRKSGKLYSSPVRCRLAIIKDAHLECDAAASRSSVW